MSLKRPPYDVTLRAGNMKPQTRLVLNYLRKRKITTFIAVNSLGVASLSSRVAELRHLGYAVKDEWAKDFHGARYKRYKLERP